MVETLLPPASTSLERALSRALSFTALDAEADSPARIRTELPPAFAPFIAAEFFLSGFTNYFDSAEELIHAGLPWLRQRGTAAAVKRALRWIQIEALLDDDVNWLHIDPGTPRAPAKLSDIRNIVNLSIPAHVYFYRMFHRYDIRHAINDHSYHDDCIWDDDSGTWIDGVKISIEEHISIPVIKPESPCTQAITSLMTITVRREYAYWDSWVLDSEMPQDQFGGAGQLMSITAPDRMLATPLARAIGDRALRWVVPRLLTPPQLSITAQRAQIAPQRFYKRTWRGPWVGPWRLSIPFKQSEE